MYLRYIPILFFILCTNSIGQPVNISEKGASENQITTTKPGFTPGGFFTYERDLRLCVYPLCGGVFVKAVNSYLTRCADGQLRKACYIATITNPNDIDLAKAGLLKGRIVAQNFAGFGNLGLFDLTAAYKPATLKMPQGVFVGIKNNGLACITSPCFSYDEYLLNSKTTRKISNIDFTKFGAPPKILAQIWQRLANGRVLLASGYHVKKEELAGTGVNFIAKQVFLPLPPRLPPQ